MNLSNLDLNLLKVLHVLLEERNVTHAGKRLGRSQPAVSSALGRLRELLDDPLLVRSGRTLVLTPRAETLRQPLNDMIGLAEKFLSREQEFDALACRDTLRISAPDRVSIPLLPPLLERLRLVAPEVTLHVMTADREQAIDLLEDGATDVAIGWLEALRAHMSHELLFRDGFVCLCRRRHPLLRGAGDLDIDRLLTFPHLVVSATGSVRAIFDELLGRMGRSRQVLVSVANFSSVPHLLERSDMVGVFMPRVSRVFAEHFQLGTRTVSLTDGLVDTTMAWHARYDRDPKNIWLREQIRIVCAQLQ